MGLPEDFFARFDEAGWDRWEDDVRAEVLPWLTGTYLQRSHSILLPESPNSATRPSVAMFFDDGQTSPAQVAVVYPGSTAIWLLGPDGTNRREISIPRELAERANTTVVDVRTTLTYQQRSTTTHAAPSRLAFPDGETLTYQVGQQRLRVDLKSGEQKLEELPIHRLPWPFNGDINAIGAQFTASTDPSRTEVSVRELESGSEPVVVWRALGGDPANGGERIERLEFSLDGRALFILTNLRLAVVDAQSGAVAATLLDDPASGDVRGLIPCPVGIALVVSPGRGDAAARPRLDFWTTTLPSARVQQLHHEATPLGLSLEGAGEGQVVVVGTVDHRVVARRGRAIAWESGLSFLGAERGMPARRLVVGGTLPAGASGFSRSLRHTGSSDQPGVRMYVSQEALAPPHPYPWWGFVAGDPPRFIVERNVPEDGRGHLLIEVYSPATGHLETSYSRVGRDRVIARSDDRRFGVVVVEEDDSRATLEVWSLPDRRSVGRLGHYPAIPAGADASSPDSGGATFLTSGGDVYLLLSRPYLSATGADLEIWRVSRSLERIGNLPLPSTYTSAFTTSHPRRAIVWRPRSVGSGPYFARVVDLSTAQIVCDLEAFGDTGNLDWSLFTPKHLVYSCRRGILSEPNDPFIAGSWDLETGRRLRLGMDLWTHTAQPEMELSPDGERVVICGNRHETGEAFLRIFDLAAGAEVGQPMMLPRPAKPRLITVADRYFVVDLDNVPSRGEVTRVRIDWSSGSPLPARGPTAPEVVDVERDALGMYGWILWRDEEDLILQKGLGGARIRLEGARPDEDQWSEPVHDRIIWPGPEGGMFAVLGRRVALWDADTGELIAVLPQGDRLLGFDPSRRRAWTFNPDRGELNTWDTERGERALICVPGRSEDVAFDPMSDPAYLSPDGTRLAVLSRGMLRIWDLEGNRAAAMIPPAGHLAPVSRVAQHDGEGLVATAGEDGVIFLWDRDDGRTESSILSRPFATTALAFTCDGKQLASAAVDGSISLLNLEDRSTESFEVEPTAPIECLVSHPRDPSILVAGTADGRVVFLGDGQVRMTRMDSEAIQSLAFSSDGTHLAACGQSGKVLVLDGRTGAPYKTFQADSPVTALAFIGNERLLATGGRLIRFWDTPSGRQVCVLPTPQGPVRAMRFDDRTGVLATLDQGDDVRLYDVFDLHSRLEDLELGFATLPSSGPRSSASRPAGPSQLEALRRRAEEHFDRKEWDQLIWVCCKVLEKDPGDWRLWYYRGVAGSRFELWDDAISSLARALELSGDDWKIWLTRAEIHEKLRSLRDAERDYSQAIKRGAPGWEPWFRRGRTRAELGELERARMDLTTALRIHPQSWQVQYLRGRLGAELGNWPQAVEDLSAIVELLPHEPRVRREYALMLLGQGDKHGFLDECRAMLERFGNGVNPDIAASVSWTCALVPGDPEDMRRCLRLAEMAFAQGPANNRHLTALGACLYRVGKYEEAAKRLVDATKLLEDEGAVNTWTLLAMSLHRQGKSNEARECLERARHLAIEFRRRGRFSWVELVESEALRMEADQVLARDAASR